MLPGVIPAAGSADAYYTVAHETTRRRTASRLCELGTGEAGVVEFAKNVGRRPGNRRWLLAVVALMLLPWGAAAFALSGAAGSARADTSTQFHDEDLYLAYEQDGGWVYVKIDMFVFDDGKGDYAAALDDAKASYLSRFAGAVEIPEGGVGAEYVTSGFWYSSRHPSWGYNSAGKPGTLSGEQTAIAAGATAWGMIGVNFSFMGGGASGAGTGACAGVGGGDGASTVGWGDQPGSVLAVTCTLYSSGSPFNSAAEFDMQIDPNWTWTTGGSPTIDLQSVTTHEFGHALGLGHSGDGSAVMYQSYTQGTLKRMPQADDIAGATAIYGATGGGSTPTNTPTSTPTRTPTPGGTQQPTNTPTPGGNPQPTNTPGSGVATSTPAGAATPTSTPTLKPANSPTPTKTPTNSLPLVPGANLLAWPGNDASPAEALDGQGSGLRIVYSYDPATGSWLRYGPGLPSFLNTLTLLRRGQAYWFIASGPAQIPFVP